ncbi:hypothetical protein [uncultured Sulfitobacter sp.]|uniref:hypothetical protein n=1 Tax=uncultured Sulfitobacter sp. TaxID=191468 RepID=UPI002608EA27|nr:hypothetical protein [uncultured Sulfitobacter sp.]
MTALQTLQAIGLSSGPVIALSGLGLLWARKSQAPRLALLLRSSSMFWIATFVLLWICVIVVDTTCSGTADKGYHSCSVVPDIIARNSLNLLVTAFLAAILYLPLLFLAGALIEVRTRR